MGLFSKLSPFIAPGIGLIGDLLSGKENREAARRANDQNDALQREFAQMGIRWKVEDARAAGIHPLIALGAQGYSASPSHITESAGRGNALSNFGQNISRSVRATMTDQERLENTLRLENMRLNNDLLIKQLNNQPTNPPMPTGGTDNFVPGQGDSGTMLVVPAKRTSHAPGRPAQEAGARPDVSYSRTDTGLVPVIPEGLSESMEDDLVGQLLWRIRNQVMPNITGSSKPPKSQLPPGKNRWRWHRFKQQWEPTSDKKDRWSYTE